MFKNIEIKNKNLTIYHRTKLSIEEKDNLFINYLQKYGFNKPQKQNRK